MTCIWLVCSAQIIACVCRVTALDILSVELELGHRICTQNKSTQKGRHQRIALKNFGWECQVLQVTIGILRDVYHF